MKKTIPVVLLLFMAACGRPKELPVLNLSAVIDSQVPDTFSWNSVAEQITYIPIETSDKILLGVLTRVVHISSDSYYVTDGTTQTIYRIDKNGKVINSFSRQGRGPGEYINLGASSVYVNQEKEIIQVIDRSGMKRIEYDLTGRLIRETDLREKEFSNALFISDDYIVFAGDLMAASHKVYVTDNDLNILHSLFPIDTASAAVNINPVGLTTMNRDMALIDPDEDETVFRITDKGAEPLFVLRAGSNRPAPDQPAIVFIPDDNRFVPTPFIVGLGIGSFQNYYLIQYLREMRSVLELWSKTDNQLVSRTFEFTLPSGKKIDIFAVLSYASYIYDNTVAFIVQADEIFEEIDGVQRDDNPVIVHIKLKN